MVDGAYSLVQRLSVAFALFWRSLKDGAFAQRADALLDQTTPAGSAPRANLATATPEAALQLLALLQQQGRLVDFLEEEVDQYSDQQVGAAARLVHQGCRQVLRDYFTVSPVREEAEGSAVRVQEGFDPAAIRLTGNLVGQAPFSGKLVHRGWRATDVRLPQVAADHVFTILAAAEVEL
jgi:hypothetical protein